MMQFTARQLRDAIRLLDDDEVIYIELADNLIQYVKGVFNYEEIEDETTPSLNKFIPQEAKYLKASQARWVTKIDSDGTISEKDIFVIEAN